MKKYFYLLLILFTVCVMTACSSEEDMPEDKLYGPDWGVSKHLFEAEDGREVHYDSSEYDAWVSASAEGETIKIKLSPEARREYLSKPTKPIKEFVFALACIIEFPTGDFDELRSQFWKIYEASELPIHFDIDCDKCTDDEWCSEHRYIDLLIYGRYLTSENSVFNSKDMISEFEITIAPNPSKERRSILFYTGGPSFFAVIQEGVTAE